MKIMIITIILALILLQAAVPSAAVGDTTRDKFGIKKIYESEPDGGREWVSKWDNGIERSWSHKKNDPYDNGFWTKGMGTGSFEVNGEGVLKITGSTPRMFIVDPDQELNWRDVEITVYGKRVDDNFDEAGITAFARINHMDSDNPCDTRGYAGELRNDGYSVFEKEISHGEGYDQKSWKIYSSEGMPENEWIGYKYIVYDLPDGNVKLEIWMDETDGANGGTWKKINEFIDNGDNFGADATPCKRGIDPALRLTKSRSRQGSESGKPNLAILFRSDRVGENGLWYKKASVREIKPVPASSNDDTAPGLAAYWNFDENREMTAIDSSGNNNKGTINGAASIRGRIGNALSFDGIDNYYVDAGNGRSLNLDDNKMTIEAWVYPKSFSETYIVSKFNGDKVTSGYNLLINQSLIYFRLGDGSTMYQFDALHGMSTYDWYHVAAVYDGRKMSIYINGELLPGYTSFSGNIGTNSYDVNIGRRVGDNSYRWNGYIDEVKIYDEALSKAEILAGYNAGLSGS